MYVLFIPVSCNNKKDDVLVLTSIKGLLSLYAVLHRACAYVCQSSSFLTNAQAQVIAFQKLIISLIVHPLPILFMSASASVRGVELSRAKHTAVGRSPIIKDYNVMRSLSQVSDVGPPLNIIFKLLPCGVLFLALK